MDGWTSFHTSPLLKYTAFPYFFMQCFVSCVTCHNGLQPHSATDPPPANSPIMHIRLVRKDKTKLNLFFFFCGEILAFSWAKIANLTPLCVQHFYVRNIFVIGFWVQKLLKTVKKLGLKYLWCINHFLPDPRGAGLHLSFQFSYVQSDRPTDRPTDQCTSP